ncbi:hypothetical protein [Streptomyces sp. NPDC048644]|uniref:hypothetical protein n=1 Tax=Streptomyces sp. NPDC048644 TaxID=3365582 RepID=UPI003719198A
MADKLTELQEKTRQGIPTASSTMAFGNYLTYWLATIAPEHLKPSTLNYEGLTRLYIRPALGKKRLNRLSLTDIRRFLTEFKSACLCCLRGADRNAASVSPLLGPCSTSTRSCGPRFNRQCTRS